MAQLNDLIVLGNSNLVGETNINGNLNINSDVTIKDTLSVEGTTYLKNNIELTRTSNTNNPYLKLTSSSGSSYLQLVGTSIGLGNGWENSLKIDNAGNASLPGSMTAGGTTIALGASANIIGTTKQATTVSNQLVLQKGAVFSGTAADAGLVTRGICGVSTPDSNGACSKDNLYINYDNDNTYRNNRQLVLQAGTSGTHYGSNLYQYAAARGDAVKGWVENSATSARTKLLETFKQNSTTDTYGTSWNFLAQWINSDRLKFKVINNGAFQDSYPIEVDHAYKLVSSSTDKNASTAPLNIGSATQPVYFSNGKPVAITGTIVTSDELDEVKTSVSEGKNLIAAAVTDKGVQTAADATFQAIATNIRSIKTGFTVTTYGPYTGEPLTRISNLPTGKTLWSDIFVCVTSHTVKPNSQHGSTANESFDIRYNSSDGTVSISSYTSTNYIARFGASEAYVYVIS